MSADPFRMVHDINAMINAKASDLQSERQFCVGPMEELAKIEAIEVVTQLQLQIQAYLADELASLAAQIKRNVEFGEPDDPV